MHFYQKYMYLKLITCSKIVNKKTGFLSMNLLIHEDSSRCLSKIFSSMKCPVYEKPVQ